jgi:hypothetical protein
MTPKVTYSCLTVNDFHFNVTLLRSVDDEHVGKLHDFSKLLAASFPIIQKNNQSSSRIDHTLSVSRLLGAHCTTHWLHEQKKLAHWLRIRRQ